MATTAPAPVRAGLVTNAVSFLRDPKTQEATIDKKVEFLRVKGLTNEEINSALSQVGITANLPATFGAANAGSSEFFSIPASSVPVQPTPTPQYVYNPQYAMMHPPPLAQEEHGRDWKDWFVMAVVSGSVMAGVYSLARKYLFPHLVPPPLTAFQETQAALDAQFDIVAKQLADLTAQSEEQKRVADEQKDQITRALEAVERTLLDVRAGEERAKAELKEIREEVENIKELVPKLVQSAQSGATNTLSDVQQELKSLKTLLLSTRTPQPPGPYAPGASSPGLSPSTSGPGGFSTSSLPFGVGSAPSPTPTPPHLLSGRPFIPSWQLASKSGAKVEEDRKTVEASKEPLESSGVLVEEPASSSQDSGASETPGSLSLGI